MFLLSLGRGVPDALPACNNTAPVHEQDFPEGGKAAVLYSQEFHTKHTEDNPFPSNAGSFAAIWKMC